MRTLVLTMIVLLTACGGEAQGPAAPVARETATPAPADSTDVAQPVVASPCEMLSESMVREAVQPGEVEITGEAGVNRQSRYCQYRWSYEVTQEEEAQYMEERMAWTTARHEARRKGEPEPPAPRYPSRDNQVFFNVLEPFDDERVASSSFDTMVQRLTEGMTIQTESLGEITTKGSEMILLEGLGDKAVWDPDDQQVSVLTGTQLFHLKVKLSGDADSRAQALQLAADLEGNF